MIEGVVWVSFGWGEWCFWQWGVWFSVLVCVVVEFTYRMVHTCWFTCSLGL